MGSISTGIGLISGINSGQLIESLLALESRGKVNLQQRIAALQSQRTALLDINARLLNLKNAARAFRIDKVFQSALATSSNEDALSATATRSAQPGTYQFIVKQLVSTSQKMTRGFADRTTSPLGLTGMSFEFGRGQLATDRDLAQLNAGAGVDRGRIRITDRSGAQATVDLTDVTNLNEVLDRINSASGIQVRASVDGDRLVVTDLSGGNGSLIIADGAGDTTATDLGIAGFVAGATLTGSNINTLGTGTALASLNDGNGVQVKDNVADFTITARDDTVLNIDLGRVNAPITNTTKLSDLNNGRGITIGPDENTDFKIIDRNGDTHDVNLTGLTTVGGLINRVAIATEGKVTLAINGDGKRLVVNDQTGGTGLLKVIGAGANGEKTAKDLGILKVAGVDAASFNGQPIPNTISDPPAATLNDVINRIAAATNNSGKIVASIADDGVSLRITDTTNGAGNLIVRRTAANQTAASSLGIETAAEGVAASTVNGTRLIASLGSVLMKNINGGAGLGNADSLTINDRAGNEVTVTGLSAMQSLSDLITAVNTQAAGAGVLATLSLNASGNGLQVEDTSGGSGNLTITGDAAEALKINVDAAVSSKRGANLQHRYVSEAVKLADLNYGRGVGTGRFRITDVTGASAEVDIGSDSVTLGDVIDEINSRGLAIRARINANGDGLLIESDLAQGQTAVSKLKIENVSGSTAKDLNILGTSATVENATIDGSYERTVTLDASDALDRVLAKINAAGIPVSATVINSGGGATPFRLSITSAISGRRGELHIDSGDVDLGLTTLTRGQDAKVFFGGDSADTSFLVTASSNTVSSILDGVTLNLKRAGDEPITLTIARDSAKVQDSVKQFVTTFNDAIGRIKQYDFFDVDAQKRGPLLGNPTTSRVREALFRNIQARALGVTTQYQYLRQVGITIGRDAQIQFDEAKFAQAYENDPQAVENLFAAFQSTPAPVQEIAPGVTVQSTEQVVTVRGFGDMFDSLLENLTNSIDGVMVLADRSFKSQIELGTKRVSEFDVRLEARRQRLQAQFAAMESALARLQSQGNALSSLAGNLVMSQTAALR